MAAPHPPSSSPGRSRLVRGLAVALGLVGFLLWSFERLIPPVGPARFEVRRIYHRWGSTRRGYPVVAEPARRESRSAAFVESGARTGAPMLPDSQVAELLRLQMALAGALGGARCDTYLEGRPGWTAAFLDGLNALPAREWRRYLALADAAIAAAHDPRRVAPVGDSTRTALALDALWRGLEPRGGRRSRALGTSPAAADLLPRPVTIADTVPPAPGELCQAYLAVAAGALRSAPPHRPILVRLAVPEPAPGKE